MRRKIVHHDDIARFQCRDENPFDIDLKDRAVHGTIMHEGRGHACQTQPPGESRGFPVTVRHTGAATFPAQGTAAQTGHLRRQAGFVNEHQALRIKVRLEIKPVLSSLQDVFTLLLQCMGGFF